MYYRHSVTAAASPQDNNDDVFRDMPRSSTMPLPKQQARGMTPTDQEQGLAALRALFSLLTTFMFYMNIVLFPRCFFVFLFHIARLFVVVEIFACCCA